MELLYGIIRQENSCRNSQYTHTAPPRSPAPVRSFSLFPMHSLTEIISEKNQSQPYPDKRDRKTERRATKIKKEPRDKKIKEGKILFFIRSTRPHAYSLLAPGFENTDFAPLAPTLNLYAIEKMIGGKKREEWRSGREGGGGVVFIPWSMLPGCASGSWVDKLQIIDGTNRHIDD